MAKIDISIELGKIDSQITEARKEGNHKKVSELRLKHKEFTALQAKGIETIKGDKKKAKKDDEGPEAEVYQFETQKSLDEKT